ncbi:MAG: hypothetical protein R3321_01120 [Nitrososphaeraceae archaeon]|nr:hypothetical protein [Nitrososphaeraceae archaeon]
MTEKLICLKEYCGKPFHAKGYCRNHYSKLLRDRNDGKKCKIENCDSKHLARGLCRKHYYIIVERKSKNEYKPLSKKTILCTFENCNNITLCKGLCSKHYYISRRINKHDNNNNIDG